MRDGDGALGLAQDTGPSIAVRQVGRLRQRLAQQVTLLVRIGSVADRSERLHPPAVGFDQSNIDPVQRGAAH